MVIIIVNVFILTSNINFVGFKVFREVVMKSIKLWDMTPYSPLSVNRRFGGTYLLSLQGQRNKFSKKLASKQVANLPWCHIQEYDNLNISFV
jgi:hypothetical protein